MTDLLTSRRSHLSSLLEAIQRCVFFLHFADADIAWPLTKDLLSSGKKDPRLFGTLSAMNERFSKLQDTLGSAMRHSMELSGENADSFLRILAFFEKNQVIDSIEDWQACRVVRNMAAHDYETDYESVAQHFNTLHELKPLLMNASSNFLKYCETHLDIQPTTQTFSNEFSEIVSGYQNR